ncbi:MAG: ribosome silencing factor [Acidimicrobiales bacterium]
MSAAPVTDPGDDIRRWAIVAAVAADDKADHTLVIDVGDVFAVSDRFVITSGSNPRQVHAIVDAIEEDLTVAGGPAGAGGGQGRAAQWVPMDYGALVVHVFHQEQRDSTNWRSLGRPSPHRLATRPDVGDRLIGIPWS